MERYLLPLFLLLPRILIPKMQAIRKMVWQRLSMTRASLRHSLKTPHSLLTASVAAVRSAYCQVATCTTVRLPVDCLQIESVIYHPFYQL